MVDASGTDELDINAIDLPTDRLTLGMLRRDSPFLFKDVNTICQRFGKHRIAALIATEVFIAQQAYAKASGQPSDPDYDRESEVHAVDSEYRRFGLSTGLQMTRQLVRKFESASVAQAKSHRSF